MFARTLSMGMVWGLANVIAFGLAPNSAAHAAYPNWSGYAPQAKRPLFRPTHGAQPARAATRWRPHETSGPRRATIRAAERLAYPVFLGGSQAAQSPSGNRNVAVAYPRIRPGPGFRPDERSLPDRSSIAEPVAPRGAQRPLSPSQFRPALERSRKTYEELWATAQVSRQAFAGGMIPYAPSPVPMLPGYGRYWPTW